MFYRLNVFAASLVLCVGLALFTASCGHDDHHHHCEGDSHDPECLQCTGDEDPYAAGYELPGEMGNFSVQLVAADPSPHIVGDNTLRVQILDTEGAPVDGVVFDVLETYSGAGDHGSPITPEYTATDTAGEYEITSLDYVHHGVWEVRMELSASGMSDRVVFTFCVEEAPAS